ncbi:MAG TPA: glycogen/starch/alpha-glucan phosphorylase [Syntrophorhabdaceae bacterium]|nr:glycogen/starch/alpha-glucan phosphorylase [Syntrophorhabdaceae bacterium]MDI9561043.1 glycogen/starch/alpha-glucan phosphorylase [Pseudomonadota bacterium]MBP8698883.1 glycogen/starch/alpha-glucan phosphorylase [Syntrophorhabdaceae bacterium]MBV6506409.1 Glycogen phosphorylase [Syntrophorhabdaceae bacterium]HNQ62660.1 glycogen/starch/alpha-glucan phosphorylase [Syntrophorhabdaceae bacterium]
METKIEKLHRSLLDNLTYNLAKDMYSATPRDKFNSVVLSVREMIVKNWINTQQRYYDVNAKRIYYLSLEFLLGRLLKNYVINLGLSDEYGKAVDVLGLSYEDALEHEWDAGLGNGGLGRLAACFLDSLATLQYPGYGYGIRYEYGIFQQKIKDGFQVEIPDNWLRYGNPWEFPRPELLYSVRFYGKIGTIAGRNGRFRMKWIDGDEVMAMAYDYPVPGFKNNTVNTLRLWAAKSSREFDLEFFNSGDYIRAVQDKNSSENISKVLYPSDQYAAGKELRLKQQYFFVSATLKDIVRRYKKFHQSYNEFPDSVAIQLNDTHPSVAIPELMRIFVDHDGLNWDDAWKITSKTFGYTNHTVLPEALETWTEGLFGYLLPRHLQIVQEIDRRFLVQVTEMFPGDKERKNRVAIISGNGERVVNMARLAIVGSHSVNGVSMLHSDILKQNLFRDFFEMMPEKFKNVTNGITPRRWLLQSNPQLSRLIMDAIGDKWATDLEELKNLEAFVEDKEFCKEFRLIKEANKDALSDYIFKAYWISFPSEYLLDCQTKRFHEYKRQLLNILHVVTMYNRIKEGRADKNITPRTVLFSGKSAPSYFMCKLIIKLIHSISAAIDADPSVSDRLRVIFVPNYDVSIAQRIMPAAELSEQISTAGYEASGTGNMKYTINGALTIGTLDGANVEIREEVGEDNFFLFGYKTEELEALRAHYNPRQVYEENKELKQAIDQIAGGYFSPDIRNLFQPIVSSILDYDKYFVLADYASYIECQERVDKAYRNKDQWIKMSILNVARSGKFSSDRSIREYAENIWSILPVPL